MTTSFMVTHGGRKFFPAFPSARDISITDIGQALSKICRFAGHIEDFYSVAQHSVIVSRLVPKEHARQALLHDATEAYLVDLPRPVKDIVGVAYMNVEERCWIAICNRFGVQERMHPSVKAADNAALFAERDQLFTRAAREVDWGWSVPAANVVIDPLPPAVAYAQFMTRFYELFPEA